MLGLFSAFNRKDLKQRYADFKEERKKELSTTTTPTEKSSNNNSTIKTEKSNVNSSVDTSNKNKNKTAFNKFINKEEKTNDTETDISELSDDEIDDLSSNIEYIKENVKEEELFPRYVINVNLNNMIFEFIDVEQKKNFANMYIVEISGFQLSIIKPESKLFFIIINSKRN
jgi:hypothetical protein